MLVFLEDWEVEVEVFLLSLLSLEDLEDLLLLDMILVVGRWLDALILR